MRTERGLVKVLDFGLAKFLKPPDAEGTRVTQPQVTIAGMVVGTVSYMAPEQALGRAVDSRTDLFSLGVVLFELATGRIPFTGGSPTEIIDHILHEIPPSPSRFAPSIPPSFDTIVGRALEKSPTFRYQSARDMHHDLRDVASELDTAPRGTSSRVAANASTSAAIEGWSPCTTFVNITREPADDWIGTGIAETVSSDLKNIHGLTAIGRARVFDAPQLCLRRASRRVARHRCRPSTRRHLGRGRRVPAPQRARPHYREFRRRWHRRSAAHGQGRRSDWRHLRAPGQDRFRAQSGTERRARGTEIADIEKRETQSVEAYESYARGMMNLRLATRDSIRARHLGFRRRDSSRSGIRDGLGRARRRVRAQGVVLRSTIWCARASRWNVGRS